MKKIGVLLVDDSKQARVLIRLMVSELAGDIEVLGEASDAFEAWEKVNQLKPDLLFLDIEMPGRSGIELARQLTSLDKIPHVIFTTAYDNYAVEAFRLSAMDYLLKPINESHLLEALNKARQKESWTGAKEKLDGVFANLQQKEKKLITIPVFNGYENINLGSIYYIKADGSYSHVVQEHNRMLTVSKNLKYFEFTLEGCADYIRVHRSYIINLKHIKRYDRSGRGTIIMANNSEIDLARDRRDEFFLRFGLA